MEYILICVILALLAGVFVLFYKNKQLQSENQQVEFEKAKSIENYQTEIAATVADYEEKQETLKNVERKKYNNLKENAAREVENMRVIKNQLAMQHSKERSEMQQKYNNEIHVLQNLITELRTYSKNGEEMNTHEILHYMKRGFVQQGIINEDELYIIPNAFLPKVHSRNGNKMEYARVDHIVLSTTGIYVIETAEWQGRMIHGLTKENAGVYSFIIDEIGKYQNEYEKEETFVFMKKGDPMTLMIENLGNPVHKAKHLATILYDYLKGINPQALKEEVKPIVYFGNETNGSGNEMIDLSNEVLPRLNDREQLVTYFRNERLEGKVLYIVQELREIKEMFKRMEDVQV
ncbi:NERD domain-containing protein [Bacillus sp. Xin]|uniref:nuclease-related domain-containing protein n=1 Tax=unclassified Bacillus (in: firmicutes) TaxID=185979 RepID=UPI00157424EC|nr:MULTISPECIES: nuclease-related domain-containing protein [unclassified Bacillus (in: firmicutes)]MBC6971601.1 NERD domain-containing protein [Bacillus sp. Xin]NSW38331.1 NERD domain-containing protein [Bacillus sp. Xin1]